MHSNNPINAAWNFIKKNTFGSNRFYDYGEKYVADATGSGSVITKELSAIGKKINAKDPNNLSAWQKIKATAMNDKGKYSGKRIAGMGAAGYMGLSAAGRIASGGGLYRDSDGNFDVIGIPII